MYGFLGRTQQDPAEVENYLNEQGEDAPLEKVLSFANIDSFFKCENEVVMK